MKISHQKWKLKNSAISNRRKYGTNVKHASHRMTNEHLKEQNKICLSLVFNEKKDKCCSTLRRCVSFADHLHKDGGMNMSLSMPSNQRNEFAIWCKASAHLQKLEKTFAAKNGV